MKPLISFLQFDTYPAAEDLFVVKQSPRAKRLALRLDTQARIFTLVVPRRVSIRRAMAFARENEGWMRTKLAELPQPIALTHGTIIPVFGQDREIRITYNGALKRTSIELKNNEIQVLTNQENPAGRLVRFLKREARSQLGELAHEKAARIDKKISKIQIRDTKSRWGSCSEDGRISLSWRLIFAPSEAMDYVVAHEVAHLEHLNHSRKFWALCEKLSEHYKEGKGWMRKNSYELMRYV